MNGKKDRELKSNNESAVFYHFIIPGLCSLLVAVSLFFATPRPGESIFFEATVTSALFIMFFWAMLQIVFVSLQVILKNRTLSIALNAVTFLLAVAVIIAIAIARY